MPHEDTGVGYVIWGVDHAVYGPVELPVLVTWIRDARVMSDTWLYLERNNCWEKASHVPELQMFFHARPATALHAPAPQTTGSPPASLAPAALRHVKVLAGLNDEQLEQFLQLMEVLSVPAGTQVTRQSELANAMYLVLEGELRVHLLVDGRETSLGRVNAGEFFGEISLFDHGPRYADVIANRECTLLKIDASDFEKLAYEKPELASPFLLALTKTLACRMRAEHKRYRDSLAYIHPPNR